MTNNMEDADVSIHRLVRLNQFFLLRYSLGITILHELSYIRRCEPDVLTSTLCESGFTRALNQAV